MSTVSKALLGGRYKLSGELARGSAARAWDRWLDRTVYINIFCAGKIASPLAKRRFIDSTQALARIDHPNVAAPLDFGATADGSPYHVLPDAGVELTSLAGQARAWARARRVLLDVIAGLEALHRRRIVHGEVSRHAVALVGDRAQLVEFGDAQVLDHPPSAAELDDDARGVAALGFWLLTGASSTGRSPAALAAALAQTDAPTAARAALLHGLTTTTNVELAALREAIFGAPRARPDRLRAQVVSAIAGVAATAMLSIGLWSSYASFQLGHTQAVDAAAAELACAAELGAELEPSAPPPQRSTLARAELEPAALGARQPGAPPSSDAPGSDAPSSDAPARFEASRARNLVGSEARRDAVVVQSKRFNLRHDLSPATLVERGIDLTHGRPTPEDDPRLPILDGPVRARALFQAACARDYGKGCHMLGVQLAEGMITDDDASAAEYYRRGCALDYHRSCAALADLARAGQIDADVSMLEAKACLLAGPGSSFCAPE